MATDIKERIRKLLALANDKAATEDEAATAMRMAAGLMAKHGIDEASVQPADAKRKAINGKTLSRKFDQYELFIASAAADLFGCLVVTMGGGKFGFYFVGREENTEASEAVMTFLLSQLERFYKDALPKGLTKAERAEFRKTFKQACAARVRSRAHDLVDEMRRNDAAAQSATGKNALIVQGYFDTLREEVSELTQGLQPARAKRIAVGSGTSAGRAAGDQVKLRREVQ